MAEIVLGAERNSLLKETGMLFISLRCINFEFLSTCLLNVHSDAMASKQLLYSVVKIIKNCTRVVNNLLNIQFDLLTLTLTDCIISNLDLCFNSNLWEGSE